MPPRIRVSKRMSPRCWNLNLPATGKRIGTGSLARNENINPIQYERFTSPTERLQYRAVNCRRDGSSRRSKEQSWFHQYVVHRRDSFGIRSGGCGEQRWGSTVDVHWTAVSVGRDAVVGLDVHLLLLVAHLERRNRVQAADGCTRRVGDATNESRPERQVAVLLEFKDAGHGAQQRHRILGYGEWPVALVKCLLTFLGPCTTHDKASLTSVLHYHSRFRNSNRLLVHVPTG